MTSININVDLQLLHPRPQIQQQQLIEMELIVPSVPIKLEQNWFRTIVGIELIPLLEYLDIICDELDIDVKNHNQSQSSTLDCTSYFHEAALTFRINIYTDNDAFVLEYQHMTGDRWGFIDIVKRFSNNLKEMSIIPGIKLIILPDFPLDPTIALEVVTECLYMIRMSPCIDLQTEKLQYLAHLSKQEQVQSLLMLDGTIIRELQNLTQCSSEYPTWPPTPIYRYAVCILANLLNGTHGAIVIASINITEMVTRLAALAMHTNIAQVLRNCARCLKCIHTSCSSTGAVHTLLQFADVLQRLNKYM